MFKPFIQGFFRGCCDIAMSALAVAALVGLLKIAIWLCGA
jgi:hypothetical protein